METKKSSFVPGQIKFLVYLFSVMIYAGVANRQVAHSISLEAIQQRYAGKWPKTMSYVKKNNVNRYGQEHTETEYHAYFFPRFARIDKGSLGDGNAIIVDGKKTYWFKQYKNSSWGVTRFYFSDYMLGAIYFDDIEEMKQVLIHSKIDFNLRTKGMWEGRAVYVIGAVSTEDRYHTQVWYDAENLYPVRFIDGRSGNVLDTQYKIKKYGNTWFPESAKEFVNKKQTGDVHYLHVSLNGELPEKLFDIETFGSYHWAEHLENK